MTQHLIFAFSYLRIALIFKLAFSFNSPQAQKSLKNRMTFIYVSGVASFTFLFFPWLLMLVFQYSSSDNANYNNCALHRAFDVLFLLCFSMIVILLAFSIWRIRKFSKILVQSQIFANECLMVSHLAAFTYLALLNIYSQTINIIYQGSSD